MLLFRSPVNTAYSPDIFVTDVSGRKSSKYKMKLIFLFLGRTKCYRENLNNGLGNGLLKGAYYIHTGAYYICTFAISTQ